MDHSHSDLSKARGRILLGIALLILAGLILTFRSIQSKRQYDITVIPPTCTENGYSLYTSKTDGSTAIRDITPATGHEYGGWTLLRGGDAVECTLEERTCRSCAETDLRATYPETDFPRLRLYGSLEGIGKRSEVSVTAKLETPELTLDCFAALKYQGHSTLNFEKKSFTLKLFADDAHTQKQKLTLSHWNPEHKYILKANYIDATQARNLICADIWADITASREGLTSRLKSLSNYGAVDGFPIALYLNDEFVGLYTLNLHKDDDLFGMKDGRQEAILILNSGEGDEAAFLAEAAFGENTPWEVEFCGTEDTAWVRDRLNRLIRFVRESDDETFRRELGDHLDISSAIDYLIAMYTLGLTTSGTKDLVLVTYGEDQPFIASMYDMENAFGLNADGTAALGAEDFLPTLLDGTWDSATGSLLWDRLLQNFFPRIQNRYAQLRQSLLDPESLCRRADSYIASIPTELYEKDLQLYRPGTASLPDGQQITQYLTQRIRLLDAIFLGGANQ